MLQRNLPPKSLVVVAVLVVAALAVSAAAWASMPTSREHVPVPRRFLQTNPVESTRPSPIIEAFNHSFFDGSATGGGFIYLQGVALKTSRGKAKIRIGVEAIRTRGGRKGAVAENWQICRGATSCQVTRFRGNGQHTAKIGRNFCGQFDVVAMATLWLGRRKITNVSSQTYNFAHGQEATPDFQC